MNLLYFSVHQFSWYNSRKATNKTRYFDTLSDLQFSPYVPIQLIPVGVERSNGTPAGTSRLPCLLPYNIFCIGGIETCDQGRVQQRALSAHVHILRT